MAYPYSTTTPETTPLEDFFLSFAEGGRQRGIAVGDPRARKLPMHGDLAPELKGDRPLGPEGEQPSPSGRRPAQLPGAGLKGESFTAAIRAATVPGAAAREAAMPRRGGDRTGSLPRVAANFVGPVDTPDLPESIRAGAVQPEGDPWGVDVSLSGMLANERAHQLIEGRYQNRLRDIEAARAGMGGTPQEQDLRARKIDAEATALTPPPRPLTGEGGVFQAGPDGTIVNAPQRPPATMAQRQHAIFQRVHDMNGLLKEAHATGDKAKVAEMEALYERVLRESELELSALAGRPITGSRQSSIDLGPTP